MTEQDKSPWYYAGGYFDKPLNSFSPPWWQVVKAPRQRCKLKSFISPPSNFTVGWCFMLSSFLGHTQCWVFSNNSAFVLSLHSRTADHFMTCLLYLTPYDRYLPTSYLTAGSRVGGEGERFILWPLFCLFAFTSTLDGLSFPPGLLGNNQLEFYPSISKFFAPSLVSSPLKIKFLQLSNICILGN